MVPAPWLDIPTSGVATDATTNATNRLTIAIDNTSEPNPQGNYGIEAFTIMKFENFEDKKP